MGKAPSVSEETLPKTGVTTMPMQPIGLALIIIGLVIGKQRFKKTLKRLHV
ncbi:MAG TPA: LPXTG cell wall anchor domain-containing protein [Syntrophomonadaceae bacterium]|nr:LPXTG cell wall anchor domain-containing protein [Syntrophomonadaceae bacterium]